MTDPSDKPYEPSVIEIETAKLVDQLEHTVTDAARLNLSPEEIEKQLLTFVLVLVELIRQLMEAQALSRMEHGRLTETEIDRLGEALFRIKKVIEDLKRQYSINDEEFNIDLGPLGRLI